MNRNIYVLIPEDINSVIIYTKESTEYKILNTLYIEHTT
jgi:hypothetical protein